jgi:hypothetical protein
MKVLFRIGVLMLALTTCCEAQHQLVLLKRETVEARWLEGDVIYVKMKDGEKMRYRIGQIGPFYIVTPQLDTIEFAAIEKVKIVNGQRGLQTLSSAMIWGGLGYFTIDQVNRLFFITGGRQFDEGVALLALPTAAAGLALRLSKRKYHPLRKRKLLRASPNSPFYRAM